MSRQPSRRDAQASTPAVPLRTIAAAAGRTGKGHEPGSPAPRRGDLRGYALVLGSTLLFGLTPVLFAWVQLPTSFLLLLRYLIAAAVLLLLFWRRRPLASVFRPGVWPWFVLLAAIDASQAFAYFYSVRALGVAAATFIYYLQPLWVALLAPRVLHVETERVIFIALPAAFAGLALVLAPSLSGTFSLSVAGVAAALLAGMGFAVFQVIIKRQTREVSSVSAVVTLCLFDALFLLPVALWQTAGRGYSFTAQDLIAILVVGLFTTALAFTMWMEGVGRIRVQHSAILGLLDAVISPVFAFVLLGQTLTFWVVAGGLLIVAAGALVVLRGSGDPEPEPPL